ncbi:Fc receptor 3 [Pelobates cultripes]|uniref:Fc receptor 3 n=1 Tax=Pelobates cultripes TaxID=61616 RepID=A0AAD1TKF1_PELCU|nr:Fc receptor 3 [Pelobates cultripes]
MLVGARTAAENVPDLTCTVLLPRSIGTSLPTSFKSTIKCRYHLSLEVTNEKLVRPVISVTPNTRKIFIGDSITLTCNVESVSQGDQNYYWYKDSKYVYITGKTFTIQSAEIDDSGDYQCETERGDQSDAFNLDVGNDLSTRVTVILGPPGGLITKGERLKVTCSVDRGSGNLEFKWCKQDSENCNKMYQAGSHQEHFLVESVVESYSGDYFCSVTANNIQVVFKSETVKISVHGKNTNV